MSITLKLYLFIQYAMYKMYKPVENEGILRALIDKNLIKIVPVSIVNSEVSFSTIKSVVKGTQFRYIEIQYWHILR